MIQLGLDPSKATLFYKEYPYPQRRAVAEWLHSKGIRMFPRTRIEGYCAELDRLPPEQIGDVVIVEDGGFFVPAMHLRHSRLLKQTIGVVEQTRRGIMNTEDAVTEFPGGKLALPVLSVASSRLKNEFEPPYIGQAVISNIQKLIPHLQIPGRRFAILGYGTIGQKVADGLRNLGANVTVFDRESQRKLLARQNGFSCPETPLEAVQNASFVIGCSGRRSIDADVISGLQHATNVVSASSELYEVDLQELRQRSRLTEDFMSDGGALLGTTYVLAPDDRRINVLANGYPINFWGVASMPEHASDLIMTLLLLATVEVARRKYPEAKINPEAINEIADDSHPFCVTKKFLQTHNLG
jgi:adenosylhomocysteinase